MIRSSGGSLRLAGSAPSRDPFTRDVAMDPMGGLRLSGILWDASAPIAIINGQMVQVGDDLEGYQVVEISS